MTGFLKDSALNGTSLCLFSPDSEYICNVEKYSPGCRACRLGKWLCIFLSNACNAACTDCPAPKNMPCPRSAVGNNLEDVLEGIKDHGFEGISFSGGEALIEFDCLLEWISSIRSSYPNIYIWLYTNGLLATKQRIQTLVHAGLDEVRFNLSATRYQNDQVLANLESACSLAQVVAVEVPAIPSDETILLSIMPFLEELGVRYLNLHEFIPYHSSVDALQFFLDDRQKVLRQPLNYSFLLSLADKSEKLLSTSDMVVNICSHESKRHQMSMRRMHMSLKEADHTVEQVTKEGYIDSVLVEYKDGHVAWVHPDTAKTGCNLIDISHAIRYLLRPRMSFSENRKVVSAEPFFLTGSTDYDAIHLSR